MASELYKPITISERDLSDYYYRRTIDDNFMNLARHLNDIRQWIDINKIEIDLDDIDDGTNHVKMTNAEDTKLGTVETDADVTGDHQADVDIDNITDGTNFKKMTAAEDSKLGGVEALADVTSTHEAATVTALTGLDTDNLAASATKKYAAETGADITGGHESETVAAFTGRDADDLGESATKKWAGETGADVTGSHEAATIASQGALATLDTVTAAINVENSLRKIYDNTLTGIATSVTLSALSGNTDLHYFISARWVKNGTGNNNFGLQLNADAGVNNYGWRTIYSDGNGYADDTWFMLWMGRADTDDYISEGHGWLEAGSGFVRNLQGTMSREVSPTSIAGMYAYSDYWWNTADEVTSIVFLSENASGLNVGTRLEVIKRVGA